LWGSSQIHTHKLKKILQKKILQKILKNNVWLYTAPLIFYSKSYNLSQKHVNSFIGFLELPNQLIILPLYATVLLGI